MLYDALWNEACAYSLLAAWAAARNSRVPPAKSWRHQRHYSTRSQPVKIPARFNVMKAEQSNTSVKFGDRVIMKLYRRVEPGMNPELEIGRALTARRFRHSPSLVGALEYTHENDEPMTLALAQTFIANQGNAWEYTLSAADPLPRQRLLPGSEGHSLEAIHDQRVREFLGHR